MALKRKDLNLIIALCVVLLTVLTVLAAYGVLEPPKRPGQTMGNPSATPVDPPAPVPTPEVPPPQPPETLPPQPPIRLVAEILADRPVDEDTKFLTGERFQLELTCSADGHLYIFHRSCAGDYRLLFPLGREDHRIERNETRTLPDNDRWTFDGEPGIENIYVIVARQPVEWLEAMIDRHPGPDPLDLRENQRLKQLLRGSAGPVRRLELNHVRAAVGKAMPASAAVPAG